MCCAGGGGPAHVPCVSRNRTLSIIISSALSEVQSLAGDRGTRGCDARERKTITSNRALSLNLWGRSSGSVRAWPGRAAAAPAARAGAGARWRRRQQPRTARSSRRRAPPRRGSAPHPAAPPRLAAARSGSIAAPRNTSSSTRPDRSWTCSPAHPSPGCAGLKAVVTLC